MQALGRNNGAADLRRTPRVRVELTASVEIRAQSSVAIATASKSSFSVLLRDVSAGGVAFVAPRPRGVRGPDLLERGARLTVKIPHVGRALEIPASIVWLVKPAEDGQPVAVGVRLHPEVTDSATRRSWDLWIRSRR